MNNRIVIASVLKPVADVRGYWKVAQSILKTSKYEVNIIGNGGKIDINHDKIQCYPHSFQRAQWLRRIAIRYQILFRVLKIRPAVLIITTHELLVSACFAKWLTGCKLIYDVQENHAINATMNGTLGKIVGRLINRKERWASTYVNQFWLAEKCYANELDFVKKNFQVIQNKAFAIEIDRSKTQETRALFSGTISEYASAKEAMMIMKKLASHYDDFEGLFIGQIHDPKLEKYLKNEIKDDPSIKIECSNDPRPYNEILEAIRWANLGIISYLPNHINEGKVPTKLYEYSRYKLPYLIQKNTLWSKVGARLGGAIPIDFHQFNLNEIALQLSEREKLFQRQYPDQDTWEHEFMKVINSINSLLE